MDWLSIGQHSRPRLGIMRGFITVGRISSSSITRTTRPKEGESVWASGTKSKYRTEPNTWMEHPNTLHELTINSTSTQSRASLLWRSKEICEYSRTPEVSVWNKIDILDVRKAVLFKFKVKKIRALYLCVHAQRYKRVHTSSFDTVIAGHIHQNPQVLPIALVFSSKYVFVLTDCFVLTKSVQLVY